MPLDLSANTWGFIIGVLFGGALFLGGLADPDKIIGTLRLKDFHAMRTIAVFVLVGMLGVWILNRAGVENFSIKPAAVASVLIGGALLGIGFGLTGYCPGTGLACTAAGRIDALMCVLGMIAGGFLFIWLHPAVAVPLDDIANHGKTTLWEFTKTGYGVWVWALFIIGAAALWLTKGKKRKT